LPPELSGGERQKVAFARALVSEPVLFLADEPTANLDPLATEEILDLLTKIHNQGTTVIVTTNQEQVYQKFNQKINPAQVLELELGKLK
jgi:putative ABC transport system ATP-binding protein